jgi:hypothetical protein
VVGPLVDARVDAREAAEQADGHQSKQEEEGEHELIIDNLYD